MKYGMTNEASGGFFSSLESIRAGVRSWMLSGQNLVTHYRYVPCLLSGGKTTASVRVFR